MDQTLLSDSQTVRVRVAGCQADYYRLALLAQPHSALLQQVVFESCEPDSRFPDGERLSLSVLVPPAMLEHWRTAGDGVAPEAMCVFHAIVGTDSTGWWARIPREGGHGFHGIVGASRLRG